MDVFAGAYGDKRRAAAVARLSERQSRNPAAMSLEIGIAQRI